MRSRLRYSASAAAIIIAVTGAIGVVPANAAAPAAVTAWYMYGTSASALDSAATNDGCAFAANHPGTGNRVMMLDFGAARDIAGGWGAVDFSNVTFSNGQILTALESASNGVHNCYTRGFITITYGNSNYHMSNSGMSGSDAYNAGYYQEQRAAELATFETNAGRIDQGAAAGSDMEPSWDGTAITKQLVDGATARSFAVYYDFGSADGCPTSGSGGSCNNGWSVSTVAYVSFHGAAVPLPEIYPPLATLAAQWTVVRRNWNANNTSSYEFWGVTGAPGDAQAGWNDLAADNSGLVRSELICFGC
jgi:hypothetical protein